MANLQFWISPREPPMIDNKIRKLTEHFAKKREIEKRQLANLHEHKSSAIAGFAAKQINLPESAEKSLIKKAVNADIPLVVLKEVYRRGYLAWNENVNKSPDSFAFDRVNSFVAGGKAAEMDRDLNEYMISNVPTNTAAGGNIRGLGYVSGDPAVDQGSANDYQSRNVVDSDQKQNILRVLLKKHHFDLHKKKHKYQEEK